jgi:hypothetical protein
MSRGKTSLTITATTAGTAQEFMTSGAINYLATRHLIECVIPRVDPGTTAADYIVIALYDGSTDLGRVGVVTTPAAGDMQVPVHVCRRLTPTAASHTYRIMAWKKAGSTGTVELACGGGGVDTVMPAYLRISRVFA